MRSEVLIQDFTDSTSSDEFRVAEEKVSFRTEEIETRIQHICDRHTDLKANSNRVWLNCEAHTYDPNLDLCVKVEAVRWMLRIAKHMTEPAREVMFLRIENSLRQLEAAVESRPRPVQSGARTERLYRSAHA
jgi:hypothetical protein